MTTPDKPEVTEARMMAEALVNWAKCKWVTTYGLELLMFSNITPMEKQKQQIEGLCKMITNDLASQLTTLLTREKEGRELLIESEIWKEHHHACPDYARSGFCNCRLKEHREAIKSHLAKGE